MCFLDPNATKITILVHQVQGVNTMHAEYTPLCPTSLKNRTLVEDCWLNVTGNPLLAYCHGEERRKKKVGTYVL